MLKWIIGLITVLLAICVILLIQNRQKLKKDTKLQRELKPIVDDAFDYACHNTQLLMNKNTPLTIQSSFVSDVWGKGVTAFEYLISNSQIMEKDLGNIRESLIKKLNDYAQMKHLASYNNYPIFVISDIWISNNYLHIDVAYISNAETLAYISDVAKSDQTIK